MIRYISCLAVFLLVGAPLRAGELDKEFGTQSAAAPAATLKTIDPANAATAPLVLNRDDRPNVAQASELDAEAPAQSWRHWGGWGFGRGFGWGLGRGFGWGGWGFGRGLGWGLGWCGLGLGWGGWGGGWGGWGGYMPYLGYGYGGGWGCW